MNPINTPNGAGDGTGAAWSPPRMTPEPTRPRPTLKFPGAGQEDAEPTLIDCQVGRLHLGIGLTVSTVAHLVLVDGVPEMIVDLVARHVTDEEAASYRFT